MIGLETFHRALVGVACHPSQPCAEHLTQNEAASVVHITQLPCSSDTLTPCSVKIAIQQSMGPLSQCPNKEHLVDAHKLGHEGLQVENDFAALFDAMLIERRPLHHVGLQHWINLRNQLQA